MTKTTEVVYESGSRVRQGDVVRDIEFLEFATERDGLLHISRILFPLAVVLTQDCDLQQDRTYRIEERENRDKVLISALLAPLYNAEHVFRGEHLEELKIRSQLINRKRSPGDTLMCNCNPRYHYLEFPPGTGLPPCIIDFKHYFSIPILELEARRPENVVCQVAGLYREDISQRFAAFLSRIGLPDARAQQGDGAASPRSASKDSHPPRALQGGCHALKQVGPCLRLPFTPR